MAYATAAWPRSPFCSLDLTAALLCRDLSVACGRPAIRDYEETAQADGGAGQDHAGVPGDRDARSADGFGITVSYWRDEASIRNWRRYSEHVMAQERASASGTSTMSYESREWNARIPARRPRLQLPNCWRLEMR